MLCFCQDYYFQVFILQLNLRNKTAWVFSPFKPFTSFRIDVHVGVENTNNHASENSHKTKTIFSHLFFFFKYVFLLNFKYISLRIDENSRLGLTDKKNVNI